MYLYGLIGLIIGIMLGVSIMKLKNKKSYQQSALEKNNVKKNTQKLTEYQKELNNHFNQNIKLLDIITNNYQILYQYITKSSNILFTDHKIQDTTKNSFYQIQNNNTEKNTQCLTEVPRDYPENRNIK